MHDDNTRWANRGSCGESIPAFLGKNEEEMWLSRGVCASLGVFLESCILNICRVWGIGEVVVAETRVLEEAKFF